MLFYVILFKLRQKNWYEAFADCLERNMELASVESEEEYHELMKQISAFGKIYTQSTHSLLLQVHRKWQSKYSEHFMNNKYKM